MFKDKARCYYPSQVSQNPTSQQHATFGAVPEKSVTRRSIMQTSLLLPVGLVSGASLLAGCGIALGGDAGTGEDPDKLIKDAVGNELALIQAIGAANYAGNAALSKQFQHLIEIHTAHAKALDPNASLGSVPSATTKLSPATALSRVRAAQRTAMTNQKNLALQAATGELAFKLSIICASEAQCSAHLAKVQA